MTLTQEILTIAAVVAGTMATRFLPFLLFPEGRQPPAFVRYLGTSWHGLPEVIGILFVGLLHKWKHNILLSIAGGTVLYMVLVQTVFA